MNSTRWNYLELTNEALESIVSFKSLLKLSDLSLFLYYSHWLLCQLFVMILTCNAKHCTVYIECMCQCIALMLIVVIIVNLVMLLIVLYNVLNCEFFK